MDRRAFMLGTGAAILAAGSARAQNAAFPSYYPADYAKIVEAAKKEGRLLIYSSMTTDQWSGVVARFRELYPTIRVETLDLGTSEITERYLAERGSNSATADLLATGPEGFIEPQRRGELVDYASPERAHLAPWSLPSPGLYTFAIDPVLFVWNKAVLPENLVPKSFEDFVAKVKANPQVFNKRITTYGADTGAYGYTMNYAFAKHHGEKAWRWYEEIGPMTRLERSSGPMFEKVTTGEYAMAYLSGSGSPWNALRDPARAKVIGWSFIADGTPMMTRSVGVMKGASNPNAARLMVDVMCSLEGQKGLAKGQRTPVRPDVSAADVGGAYTYTEVVKQVGEANIIPVGYDAGVETNYNSFIARWRKAYGIG
jgi:iron(III) transport system substrate-binding protein